ADLRGVRGRDSADAVRLIARGQRYGWSPGGRDDRVRDVDPYESDLSAAGARQGPRTNAEVVGGTGAGVQVMPRCVVPPDLAGASTGCGDLDIARRGLRDVCNRASAASRVVQRRAGDRGVAVQVHDAPVRRQIRVERGGRFEGL